MGLEARSSECPKCNKLCSCVGGVVVCRVGIMRARRRSNAAAAANASNASGASSGDKADTRQSSGDGSDGKPLPRAGSRSMAPVSKYRNAFEQLLDELKQARAEVETLRREKRELESVLLMSSVGGAPPLAGAAALEGAGGVLPADLVGSSALLAAALRRDSGAVLDAAAAAAAAIMIGAENAEDTSGIIAAPPAKRARAIVNALPSLVLGANSSFGAGAVPVSGAGAVPVSGAGVVAEASVPPPLSVETASMYGGSFSQLLGIQPTPQQLQELFSAQQQQERLQLQQAQVAGTQQYLGASLQLRHGLAYDTPHADIEAGTFMVSAASHAPQGDSVAAALQQAKEEREVPTLPSGFQPVVEGALESVRSSRSMHQKATEAEANECIRNVPEELRTVQLYKDYERSSRWARINSALFVVAFVSLVFVFAAFTFDVVNGVPFKNIDHAEGHPFVYPVAYSGNYTHHATRVVITYGYDRQRFEETQKSMVFTVENWLVDAALTNLRDHDPNHHLHSQDINLTHPNPARVLEPAEEERLKLNASDAAKEAEERAGGTTGVGDQVTDGPNGAPSDGDDASHDAWQEFAATSGTVVHTHGVPLMVMAWGCLLYLAARVVALTVSNRKAALIFCPGGVVAPKS